MRRCVTDCECNTGNLVLASAQPVLMKLKLWLRTVTSFDIWVFNLWPVVAGLFVNGYKGAEAHDDARVGNLAKQERELVYAIDEATTAIPTSVLADIKQILEDKHWLRIKGGEGRSHEATPRLLRRRGVVDGEFGLHHRPSPIGKTPSAKIGR